MPIYINNIELPEPVGVKLEYEPVLKYDKVSVDGTLCKIYEPITKFAGTANEYETVKFDEEYILEIYNLTLAQYQSIQTLDGQEVTLRIRRGLKINEAD